MKASIKFLTSVFTLLIFSVTLGSVTGMPFAGALGVSGGAGVVGGIVQQFVPGTMFAGLYPEVWTGELVKLFRHEGTFLSRITDYSRYVKGGTVLHLVDVGADPDVLINNTTYPIAVTTSADGDISITLNKFDTKNTAITDDELHGLSYDKIGLKVEQHKLALEDKTLEYALHSLAPAEDTTNTPIVATTGDSNGEANPRKRMKIDDIIKLKRKMDDLKVPKQGRELVLCSQHVEDLLLSSQAFKDQWFKIGSGEILNMFGFTISECTYNPVYTANAKKAFAAAAAPTTDQNASVAFVQSRCVKATGDVKAYLREAKNDPENRKNTLGYRLYNIVIPKKTIGFGAITSTVVS